MKRAPACSRGLPALPPHPSPSPRPTQPPSAPSHLQCSFPSSCSVTPLFAVHSSSPSSLRPPQHCDHLFLEFWDGEQGPWKPPKGCLEVGTVFKGSDWWRSQKFGGHSHYLGLYLCQLPFLRANRDHQPSILPHSKALSPFKFR